MARVLVLGGGGMAGHMVRVILSERGHKVAAVARTHSSEWAHLDVTDTTCLEEYLKANRPEIIVNCVGVLIKESKSNPERAIRINALLPHVLSRLSLEHGCRLIHLSSDCVFSGKSGPYLETDLRDADDIYGRTKTLGELTNDRDLTIRTSIVGPELRVDGTGLFTWFMRQNGKIKGYACAVWSGVTTLELAKAVDVAILEGTTGLVHLTNGKSISKYELLRLFQELWQRNAVEIVFDESEVSYRALLCSRADYTYPVPSYRTMLEEMKAFMDSHRELYTCYETTTSRN